MSYQQVCYLKSSILLVFLVLHTFFLQNWGDYTYIKQGIIIYVTYASDVLLNCWCGSQPTQHVRRKIAVIVAELVNTLFS
jgi:hypothetical protein